MVKFGLYVHLEAKPGKEEEVAKFLADGAPLAQEEPGTIDWFAMRMGKSTFGIFDTFEDEDGRKAHLAGKIAQALSEHAGDLLKSPPSIGKVDILGAKR